MDQYTLQNKVFFYAIMAVLGALGLWLVSGYLGVIVFSLVMVIILKPVYDFFEIRLKMPGGLATAATLVALVLILFIPGWLALRVVSNQISEITDSLAISQAERPQTVEEFQARANELIGSIPYADQLQLTDDQITQVQSALTAAVAWLGQVILNLGMAIPTLIAKLFIFLAIVGVLLPNYDRFVQRLVYLSPLDDEVDRIFLRKIKAMVWSMFVGIAIIALIQGLITGLFFWFGDVPYTPLWTLIAIIASTLPLGASMIVFPVAIFQLIAGNTVSALIVLAGYILIVTNIDNLVRPKLVSKEAYLDAALVLVAALGGYDLFGFFGVIYGPVLMVLLMTTIEVYGQYYANPGKPVVSSRVSEDSDQVLTDQSPAGETAQ